MRDRTTARRTVLRAVSRLALAAAAVGLVALSEHARSLGARLDRLAVVPGESPGAAPDPSAPGPFAPFRFGVVGPVRGDAAQLERSVEALAAEGAAFIVLVGDVTGEDGANEERRLALACRDRGPEIVAVPGPHDVTRPEFPTYLCAPRWWFRHREVLFVGAPGTDSGDPAWLRSRLADADPARRTFVVTADPGGLGVVAGPATVLGPEAPARIVEVGEGGLSVHEVTVASGFAFDTTVRATAVAIEPLVRTTVGHVAVLSLAVLLLAGALGAHRFASGDRRRDTTSTPSST